jgi:hypothetical protein
MERSERYLCKIILVLADENQESVINLQFMADNQMKFTLLLLLFCLVSISCNPFAPGLDNSKDEGSKLLSDQKTTDGVFQNIKYAYTFHDTTVYGQLIDGNFTFIYRDYDNGRDVSWGRDEEMRATMGLFQNTQQRNLVWNDTIATSMNSDSTQAFISRTFRLSIIFNPNNWIDVNGNATLQMERPRAQDPWMIVRWNDTNY